jgi:hypothetical protein
MCRKARNSVAASKKNKGETNNVGTVAQKKTLSLTFPEQNIRIPECTKRGETERPRHSFALFELDVICY